MTRNDAGRRPTALSRRAAVTGAATLGAVLLGGGSGRGVRAAMAAIAANSPAEFIQRIGDQTIGILQTPQATRPQKLKQLKQLLDRSTDLELVARLVMGRYWRQASTAQQQEFIKLFNQLIMQAMAERFSWYTGQTFEITGSSAVDERDTMVSTKIIRPSGGAPINVDWRVRRSDKGFLLIDIVAEGVSLVVTQRSDAAEVINQRGIDGLLAQMRDRVAKRDANAAT